MTRRSTPDWLRVLVAALPFGELHLFCGALRTDLTARR